MASTPSAYRSVVGGKLSLKRPGGAGSAAPGPTGVKPMVTKPSPSLPPPASVVDVGTGVGGKRRPEEMSGGLPVPVVPPRTTPATGGGGAGAAADAARQASAVEGPSTAATAEASLPALKASHDGLTPAQRAHEEAMARRAAELARRDASKTHRERVAALNSKLASLPEHNDIPKISYAGTG